MSPRRSPARAIDPQAEIEIKIRREEHLLSIASTMRTIQTMRNLLFTLDMGTEMLFRVVTRFN